MHGCVLGIGERVGNAPLDLLLINLKLLGELPEADLSKLAALAEKVAAATRFRSRSTTRSWAKTPSARDRRSCRRRSSKAKQKGDDYLADRVYSGVPAGMFGREQEICVGPMSGISNAAYWLQHHGYDADQGTVDAILKAAKNSDHNLSDPEVRAVVERHRRGAGHRA
ncbi:MAG: hypothetical protein R3A78_07770 [Polyangiales bacterium]